MGTHGWKRANGRETELVKTTFAVLVAKRLDRGDAGETRLSYVSERLLPTLPSSHLWLD